MQQIHSVSVNITISWLSNIEITSGLKVYCNIYTLNTDCLARQYLVSPSHAFPTQNQCMLMSQIEYYHYHSVCRYVVVDGLHGVHVVQITTGPGVVDVQWVSLVNVTHPYRWDTAQARCSQTWCLFPEWRQLVPSGFQKVTAHQRHVAATSQRPCHRLTVSLV